MTAAQIDAFDDTAVSQGTGQMPFGASVKPDGSVTFRLWAPSAEHVTVQLDDGDEHAMSRSDGWFQLNLRKAAAGTRYRYIVDGVDVPDPASRWQPGDVAGFSQVIDPGTFAWQCTAWRGRPWEETVIYEVHVGTFTAEGTFTAAIEKLDHLVALGITAIELMPLADFPGLRNWGYDGVLLYAPDSAYGSPDDLRRLVDAAHQRGLMVFLDVVYNHFGPQGNFMGTYAPDLFTDKHQTPWGNAVNYACPEVRSFVIENACYWLREFRFDGLRLDAVHAIVDESPKHILKELSETVRARALPGQHVHLMIENDKNEPGLLERDNNGDPIWFNAQWNDDFHHCLHAAATKESFGYYAAYRDAVPLTARALAEGFAYQGEVSPFSQLPRGAISAYLPPTSFVSFIQNHDQIGNRAFGERITDITGTAEVRAITAIYLIAPEIPLLFMGEEWRSGQPFPYFCGFDGELAQSIRDGRKEEFKDLPELADPGLRDKIPDPTAEATFLSAKLDWACRDREPHAAWLDWYRNLLAVRRDHIVPNLAGALGGVAEYAVKEDGVLQVSWRLGNGRTLSLIANFSSHGVVSDGEWSPGNIIWQEGTLSDDGKMPPWFVLWQLD